MVGTERYFSSLFDGFFFLGTLAPFLRASARPMAIACLRLVTFLPDFPMVKVPAFCLCTAFSTLSDVFLLSFAIMLPSFHRMIDTEGTPQTQFPLGLRLLHDVIEYNEAR
jgi:hypothetical protein